MKYDDYKYDDHKYDDYKYDEDYDYYNQKLGYYKNIPNRLTNQAGDPNDPPVVSLAPAPALLPIPPLPEYDEDYDYYNEKLIDYAGHEIIPNILTKPAPSPPVPLPIPPPPPPPPLPPPPQPQLPPPPPPPLPPAPPPFIPPPPPPPPFIPPPPQSPVRIRSWLPRYSWDKTGRWAGK